MSSRILVVDDEADIVESIRFNLEAEGYDVMTAADGAQALEKARREHPDLIVMDVMMPIENGYRVARLLSEDYDAGRLAKRIPVILLTARSSEQDVWDGWQQGVDYYMTKPFDPGDLLDALHRLVPTPSGTSR